MDRECELAFLNWVAYHLKPNNCKPYGHFSCPLTGCPRNDLENFESYLQHVAKCPCLPGATYRCPYCNRDECFAVGTLRYEKKTKDYKHGAVVSFFKHFGRKIYPKHTPELQADDPVPRYYPGLQATGIIDEKRAMDWLHDPQVEYPASNFEFGTTPEMCTLNYRGSYIPIPGELPTPLPILGELPTPCQRSELLEAGNFATGVEMSGTRSYIYASDRTDSDNHNIPTGHASISSQISEQWSEKSQDSPHSAMMSPEPLRYHGSISQSRHRRCASNDSITNIGHYDSEQRWNKASVTGHGPSPKHSSLPSDLESGMLREQSTYGSTTPRSRQALRLDIPKMAPGMTEILPLNSEAVPAPLAVTLNRQEVCRNLPHGDDKQSSVEELFQTGNSLKYLWAQKLNASPELSSIISQLDSAPALQSGLGLLRQVFESNIDVPRTTEHLFQFMHVAFACAYRSYSADGWYPWGEFYLDVLRWSQTIAEPEDRGLYLQVADLLWSTPEDMTHSMDVYSFEDYGPCFGIWKSENGSLSHHLEVDGTLSTSQQGSIPFEEAYDRLAILQRLKKGVVVKNCARYLDGT